MSPLWPDIRCLGLTKMLISSDQVQATYWPAGFRGQPQSVSANWSGVDSSDLRDVLKALLLQLPSTRWQQIEVFIADQHVHILRMPAIANEWNRIDWKNQSQQAYARALLIQTYGEVSRSWPYRLQDVCPTQDALLVAIPILESLDLNELLGEYAMQWQVKPYVFALWENSRLPKTGTILSAEPHMLRLLQLEQGRIQHIATLPIDMDAISHMAAWILRERTLVCAASQDCYWLVDPGIPALQETGHRLKQGLSEQLQWHDLPVSTVITQDSQENIHAAQS